MADYEAKTTRIEVEINTFWMEKNPELFVKSLLVSMVDFHNYKLFNIKLDISRAGFITIIAE